MVAGTAAFSGLALLMAGTLRAEATLAAANLLYLVMLGIGGVVFPLTKFPAGARPLLKLLPADALSDGLRSMLQLRRRPARAGPAGARGLGGRWHRTRRAHVSLGIAGSLRPRWRRSVAGPGPATRPGPARA